MRCAIALDRASILFGANIGRKIVLSVNTSPRQAVPDVPEACCIAQRPRSHMDVRFPDRLPGLQECLRFP